MTRLTRISLMLAFFFACDKVLGIVRQVVIARQFGLSAELDSFNVANNIPDMLYAIISGGALAMAFIPVLSEMLTKEGRQAAWDLFSRVANLAFLVTGAISLVIILFSSFLVGSKFGIAPGFSPVQQTLVVQLMRLDLLATLLFSLSGLVMAGLQANQHFFLPALAPILYNLGQIFGAVILAPSQGCHLGPITLPAYGMGIYGLVYGVIIGAVLHLAIQIPGLILYQFHWTPKIGLWNPGVQKVLRLVGPRVITIMMVQFVFIVRDNLASRLATGSVSALTYGWMIQQVPETLIGTAIGTALLPTLSEFVAKRDQVALQSVVQRAMRVLLVITIPTAILIGIGIGPLVSVVFGFNPRGVDMLVWTTRGFLLGLMGHALLEVAARTFYAQQDALTPMVGAMMNVVVYVVLGSLLFRELGAPGISLVDSTAYTLQAVFLIFALSRPPLAVVTRIQSTWKRFVNSLRSFGIVKTVGEQTGIDLRLRINIQLGRALLRGAAAGLGGVILFLGVQAVAGGVYTPLSALLGMFAGGIAALAIAWPEARQLLRL